MRFHVFMKTKQFIKNIAINTLLGLSLGHIVKGDIFPNISTLTSTIFICYPNLQVVDAYNETHHKHPNINTGFFPNLNVIESRCLVDSFIEQIFLNIQYDYTLMSAAFADSQNLNLVDLGGSLNIPNNCFENCEQLKTVWGQCVTSIENNAFYGCPKIDLVYLPKVQIIATTAFINANIRHIIVPKIFIKTVKHQNPKAQVLSAEKYTPHDVLGLVELLKTN